MAPRPLIVSLCVMMGAYTFCVGSIPVLIPEMGAALALADWQLGVIGGAFGFARMLTDIPAGLLVTHHVRRAVLAAPVFMLIGAGFVASGGAGFGWLVLGQVSMSIGYTLANLATVTIILRQTARTRLARALNAFEFSAMIALLGAVTVIGLLPRALPWNIAFLVGCAAMVVGVVALRGVLTQLAPTDPTRPWFARLTAEPAALRDGLPTVVVAFIAGAAVAVTYTTMSAFVIPLRGSREFGLERAGIAHLLMLVQACDIVALLPVGALADARGARRVLVVVLVMLAAAIGLISFGTLPHVVAGCVFFGLGMAGWMLPLNLLRSATPTAQVAWRTAIYRVCVDGGMFLGPFLSGVFAASYPALIPRTLAALLVALAALLLLRRTRTPGPV
jgi:MFS family permease